MILHNSLGVVLAALLLGLALPAHADCPDGCTINVTKVTGKDLRFGSMIVISGGTLTINPATGMRSGSAHVVTPASLASNQGPAEFRLTCQGRGSTRYTLALMTTPATVGTSSTTMALTGFVSYPPISAERTIPNCETYEEIIKVGATLQVGASQASDSFAGGTEIELRATISSIF
jgi:hypothetical protein